MKEDMVDMDQDKVVGEAKEEGEGVMVVEVEVEVEANLMQEVGEGVEVEADLATEILEVSIYIYVGPYLNHCHHFKDC